MTVTPIRDLRPAFGTARDQGNRPTCCAFASSDLHAACRPPWRALSCEYAFYHAIKRQSAGPASGVYLRHMLDAIEQDGQPLEAAWPYLASVPNDLSQWTPPSDVGELFHGRGVPSAGGLAEMKSAIDKDQPVLVVLTLSDAFYMGPDANGVIDSIELPDLSRVHALVAVGHGTRGTNGLTLVRNSWGGQWGMAGHAWLSDNYLAPRILEIAIMNKVT